MVRPKEDCDINRMLQVRVFERVSSASKPTLSSPFIPGSALDIDAPSTTTRLALLALCANSQTWHALASLEASRRTDLVGPQTS